MDWLNGEGHRPGRLSLRLRVCRVFSKATYVNTRGLEMLAMEEKVGTAGKLPECEDAFVGMCVRKLF